MSRRQSIAKAIAEALKVIDSTSYNTDLNSNVEPKLRFWDEINDFPACFVVAGPEQREYLPAGFIWGTIGISIKAYVYDREESLDKLELLIEDIEKVINSWNDVLTYDTTNGYKTAEINITSITTDEGLLSPYGIGEINLLVRFEAMK